MLRAFILVLATLAGAAFGESEDVVRVTEGYGATQQEALTNALVEAVRQARGTLAGIDRSVEETMAIVAGTGAHAVIEKTQKPVLDAWATSRGYIRQYEVLEQRASEKGVYVRIRAEVPVFQSSVDDTGRIRIAVMPFRVSVDGYQLADHGDAVTFSRRLADSLVAQYTQAPDYVVINRDFFEEIGVEKAVLAADAAPEELTRLGNSVGADFLLVGRVTEARTEVEEGPYGGKAKKTDEVRIAWRLVEPATGKIEKAGELSFDNVRKPKNTYSWKKRDDFEAGALYAALAKQLVEAAAIAASPAAADKSAAGAPTPAATETAPAELTPGSSDKPVKW